MGSYKGQYSSWGWGSQAGRTFLICSFPAGQEGSRGSRFHLLRTPGRSWQVNLEDPLLGMICCCPAGHRPCRGQFCLDSRRQEWDRSTKALCRVKALFWPEARLPKTHFLLLTSPICYLSPLNRPPPHIPSETRVLINWTFWLAHIKDNHIQAEFYDSPALKELDL